MPKISMDPSQATDHGPVVEWNDKFGDQTVNIVEFKLDLDHSALLKGLPDDRCQCPHWGYILRGSVTFAYADGEETFSAGDAFYTPPGHVPIRNEPGTQYVQFSPTHELEETDAVIMKNLAAMAPAG